jgi:hypothetical protein
MRLSRIGIRFRSPTQSKSLVLPWLSYFPAQKAVFDDRATNLGARTDRQVAADKV